MCVNVCVHIHVYTHTCVCVCVYVRQVFDVCVIHLCMDRNGLILLSEMELVLRSYIA